MGMVHSYKQGKMKSASPEVKKAAKSMSDKDAKDFASTPHKGLPKHVSDSDSPNVLTRLHNGSGKAFMEILKARIGTKGGKK
jgi:hypothetical protein